VPDLLIATDSQAVYDEVVAAVEDVDVLIRWARDGRAVLPAHRDRPADLVIADLQIGSMGGYAIGMDLALEAGAGRVPAVPVLLLLDRSVDVFLARRTGVAGWLVKPLSPMSTRAAVRALLAGDRYYAGSPAPGGREALPA
jgi:DNA-binding response OmpR family regulator